MSSQQPLALRQDLTFDPNQIDTGDILVSRWGYEQTNVHFYKVVRRTKATATLISIGAITIDHPQAKGHYTLNRPNPDVEYGKPFRRKVHACTYGAYVSLSSYSVAKKWDGRDEQATNSLSGH